MATRSRIGIENENGTIESIYCHWDGYPDNNGKILARHYTDTEKVKALIGLGDISSLHENVSPADGVSHSFGAPADKVTVAYHRDRGEDFNAPRINHSIEGFTNSGVEEYGYVFTKAGEWKGVMGRGKIHDISDALK
jgi:hypothetical protein